jgi:hypothetical protein
MTRRVVPHLFALLITLVIADPCAHAADPSSDTQAVSLLTSSKAALSGSAVISDATLAGSATYTSGSDEDTGTVTLKAKGALEGSVSLSLSGGPRSDTRQNQSGQWSGPDGQPHSVAWHNCLTPNAWFFPQALIAQAIQDPSYVAKYIGEENRGGATVQHVQLTRIPPGASSSPFIASLSTADLYLDPASFLPVSLTFGQHPDNNSLTNLAVEIQFSNYQRSAGAQIPFHIVKLFQGTVLLDLAISSASLNTGLSDSDFNVE